MTSDIIAVSGAPVSWKLRESCEELLGGLRKMGALTKKGTVVLSISCVDSAEMTKLNAQYRGKRGPTDVLSFEQPKSNVAGVTFLGDLVLCIDVVRAQAAEVGHGVAGEVKVLLAHGLLHLLGYDHEKSPAENARMARAEARLLGKSSGQSSGLIARVGMDKKKGRRSAQNEQPNRQPRRSSRHAKSRRR